MNENHISVGSKVRIRDKPFWHKVLITVVEKQRCEVLDIYSEDERWVSKSNIEPLFDFELTLSKDPDKLKSEGNMLFKLPDPHSAWQRYHRGRLVCDKLPPMEELVGCEVLYNGEVGMVSDIDENANTAEVCFDSEDLDCSIKDLTCVHTKNGKLQCSLYSNELMALFKLGKFANALKLCQTLRILSVHFEEIVFQQKSSFWKCKCHIRKRKFKLASEALAEYRKLGGNAKQIDQLEKEIKRTQKQNAQSNKRLAKEISKWTDQILQKQQNEIEEQSDDFEESSETNYEPSKMSIFCSSFCQCFCAFFIIALLVSQICFTIFSSPSSSNHHEL